MAALPEIELGAGSLVIGDLHLDVERADEVESFTAWLAGIVNLRGDVVDRKFNCSDLVRLVVEGFFRYSPYLVVNTSLMVAAGQVYDPSARSPTERTEI